jgi:hypothetical protein
MKIIRLFSLILAVALFGRDAQGTTVIPPSFDELVDQAQLIFQGTVADVHCEWAGEGAQRAIVSYVTFRVEDPIKGEPGGATYTMRMLGGTIGNETMGIADAPTFKPGDRDIVFVENNGSQFIPLVGIMYGRFRVQADSVAGKDIVTTNSGGPVAGVIGPGATEFKAAIRARLHCLVP